MALDLQGPRQHSHSSTAQDPLQGSLGSHKGLQIEERGLNGTPLHSARPTQLSERGLASQAPAPTRRTPPLSLEFQNIPNDIRSPSPMLLALTEARVPGRHWTASPAIKWTRGSSMEQHLTEYAPGRPCGDAKAFQWIKSTSKRHQDSFAFREPRRPKATTFWHLANTDAQCDDFSTSGEHGRPKAGEHKRPKGMTISHLANTEAKKPRQLQGMTSTKCEQASRKTHRSGLALQVRNSVLTHCLQKTCLPLEHRLKESATNMSPWSQGTCFFFELVSSMIHH